MARLLQTHVSIHARTRGCERHWWLTKQQDEFKVSIHARTRGCERRVTCWPMMGRYGCFNPRSHPRVRATSCDVIRRCLPISFNPRSHPRVRATAQVCKKRGGEMVSIHARTRGCERQSPFGCLLALTSFNPRSHPRVRATRDRSTDVYHNRVSIHARTRGCERPSMRPRRVQRTMFQPKSGSYPAAVSWADGSQGGSGRVILATT